MNLTEFGCDVVKAHLTLYVNAHLDYFQVAFTVSFVLNAIFALTATFLNGLIIVVIYKAPDLHRPSYFLISSLALTDILMGLVFHPLISVYIAMMNQPDANPKICLMSSSVSFTVVFLSALTNVMNLLLSIDRYLAVTLQNRYQGIITKKRTIRLILFAWIFLLTQAIIFQTVPFLLPYWYYVRGGYGGIILTFTCIFYSLSYYRLRKHLNSINSQSSGTEESFNARAYRKCLVTMVIISTCLVAFYLPAIVVTLFQWYFVTIDDHEKFLMLFFFVRGDILCDKLYCEPYHLSYKV